MPTPFLQDCQIDLLRHGEAEGGGRFRGGATDDPLTELGWQQMWTTVSDPSPWQGIISSPMVRCLGFARALADKHDLQLVIEPGFREMHFGAWEGRSAEELHQQEPVALANFWRNPDRHTPPGGEPLSVFQQRVLDGLHRQLDRQQAEHLLIIGHGGTLRMILCHLLNMPLSASARLEMPHACMSRVRMRRDEHGQWNGSLVFHSGQP